MRRVVMTRSAEADLDTNYLWWAKNRSAEQAGRWYGSMLLAINSLANNADRYPRAEESDIYGRDIREMAHGLGSRPTHRVLFMVEGSIVTILRVRHVSQRTLSEDQF